MTTPASEKYIKNNSRQVGNNNQLTLAVEWIYFITAIIQICRNKLGRFLNYAQCSLCICAFDFNKSL